MAEIVGTLSFQTRRKHDRKIWKNGKQVGEVLTKKKPGLKGGRK
jgi:hypothetical protein